MHLLCVCGTATRKVLCGSVLCAVYKIMFIRSSARFRARQQLCEKSRWPSWAPVLNKPRVSVDVKQHSISKVSDCSAQQLKQQLRSTLVVRDGEGTPP